MVVDAEAEVEFQRLKSLPGLFVIISRVVMHFHFFKNTIRKTITFDQ